jgi:hypothetical protein
MQCRFVVGLTLAETARVLGMKIESVKQLQHRGTNTLRRRLGDNADALTSWTTRAAGAVPDTVAVVTRHPVPATAPASGGTP